MGPPQSIKHRGLAYCYIKSVLLLDLVQCIYIEGRLTPHLFSIDALHTGTPN